MKIIFEKVEEMGISRQDIPIKKALFSAEPYPPSLRASVEFGVGLAISACMLAPAINDAAGVPGESGYACVSSTMLRDKSVLRLCTINPLTTADDIVQTIDRLAAARPAA